MEGIDTILFLFLFFCHGDGQDFYGMVAWLLGKEMKVYKLLKTL